MATTPGSPNASPASFGCHVAPKLMGTDCVAQFSLIYKVNKFINPNFFFKKKIALIKRKKRKNESFKLTYQNQEEKTKSLCIIAQEFCFIFDI